MTTVDEEKELTEHLEELVYRLRMILFSWAIATVVFGFAPTSWFKIPPELIPENYTPLVEVFITTIRNDMLPKDVLLFTGSWTAPITVYFLAAGLLGFIIDSPIIGYEIYAYIKPAIYPHERRLLAIFVLSFIGLFSLGAAIAYWIILPVTFRILLVFVYKTGASPLFSLEDFYSFVFFGVFTVGIVFTFPLIVALLAMQGVVDKQMLVENRRYAILAIFVAAAVFTPDPTPFSMLVLAIPLTALYELSVWVAGKVGWKEGSRPSS